MSMIENFLLAAYKKKYGVVDNAVVRLQRRFDGSDPLREEEDRPGHDLYYTVYEVPRALKPSR